MANNGDKYGYNYWFMVTMVIPLVTPTSTQSSVRKSADGGVPTGGGTTAAASWWSLFRRVQMVATTGLRVICTCWQPSPAPMGHSTAFVRHEDDVSQRIIYSLHTRTAARGDPIVMDENRSDCDTTVHMAVLGPSLRLWAPCWSLCWHQLGLDETCRP